MEIKLRPCKVIRKYTSMGTVFLGWFHCWGQQGDENRSSFFGVVEDGNGVCQIADPTEIIFMDR
jgi:hypothetical protein